MDEARSREGGEQEGLEAGLADVVRAMRDVPEGGRGVVGWIGEAPRSLNDHQLMCLGDEVGGLYVLLWRGSRVFKGYYLQGGEIKVLHKMIEKILKKKGR